jgi:hypothetical protein
MTKRMPLVAAILLLLLPLLYLGSYGLLVVRQPGYSVTKFSPAEEDNYRLGGALAQTFYWPLEQLDRRVQPSAWESPRVQELMPMVWE